MVRQVRVPIVVALMGMMFQVKNAKTHRARCEVWKIGENGRHYRRSSKPRTGRDGFSRFSLETSFPSRRLRLGRGPGEPLGGSPGGQLMVPKSDLADAVSIFSGTPPASTQSDQDVGPLVLNQFCMCDR